MNISQFRETFGVQRAEELRVGTNCKTSFDCNDEDEVIHLSEDEVNQIGWLNEGSSILLNMSIVGPHDDVFLYYDPVTNKTYLVNTEGFDYVRYFAEAIIDMSLNKKQAQPAEKMYGHWYKVTNESTTESLIELEMEDCVMGNYDGPLGNTLNEFVKMFPNVDISLLHAWRNYKIAQQDFDTVIECLRNKNEI